MHHFVIERGIKALSLLLSIVVFELLPIDIPSCLKFSLMSIPKKLPVLATCTRHLIYVFLFRNDFWLPNFSMIPCIPMSSFLRAQVWRSIRILILLVSFDSVLHQLMLHLVYLLTCSQPIECCLCEEVLVRLWSTAHVSVWGRIIVWIWFYRGQLDGSSSLRVACFMR